MSRYINVHISMNVHRYAHMCINMYGDISYLIHYYKSVVFVRSLHCIEMLFSL